MFYLGGIVGGDVAFGVGDGGYVVEEVVGSPGEGYLEVGLGVEGVEFRWGYCTGHCLIFYVTPASWQG